MYLIKYLFLITTIPLKLYSQCGSCTNPTGNVSLGSGQSACYDVNTSVTSFTIFFDGKVTICDSVLVTVTSGSGFSGTGRIELGNCSRILFKGSFTGSVNNGVVYTGDGTCDAQFSIEASSTLGSSLTADSEVRFCNVTSAPVTGSPGSATIDCSNPLPIELISFTACELDNEVLLKWQTASEINNDLFMVEKSKDAIFWQISNELAGAGNSNNVITYISKDFDPCPGVNYYRLKQIDFDGKFSYSDIISLNVQNQQRSLTYVDYLNGKLKIITNERNPIPIFITNLKGEQLKFNRVGINTFNISSVTAGVYIVYFDVGNGKRHEKIFIR